ncbi:hypothetical protein [Saccharopolyspora griseoalba]|uniref:NADP-dependent oxidoreductase domain-containing protein n=1 Tax=Saccharopolyspora griseoalba TaxID=1431848 RepID=A0ABW2LSL5_9PSEU
MAATYHRGHAHRDLAGAAGDLLERCTISTKISPRPGHPPLRDQAWRAVEDLGSVPAVMLVHNPETVVAGLSPTEARRWWSATAETMADLVARGACRMWGLASWDPRVLGALLDSRTGAQTPSPQVAMVRAGFLVPAGVLTASDTLLHQLGLPHANRWGMSPFAGQPHLLDGINLTQFLTGPPPGAAQLPAALAAAFHLPEVSRIAVGASTPAHLDQLLDAVDVGIQHQRLSDYRQRLTTHAAKAS